uniref:Uncharacterized protein n=1 Tax=Anguilla anguilla TaxID=7936 RepID=A0A0E9W9Y9_ANGAN
MTAILEFISEMNHVKQKIVFVCVCVCICDSSPTCTDLPLDSAWLCSILVLPHHGQRECRQWEWIWL